ncbi:hypothetical protein [Rhodopirellula sallentina]|uniref:Uncharacterized protein n=1 Tax=Rhodopirellula sallentina SM41 TaxID=1263870 RepID=M5TYM7_9BACT|nr:hypothetical protein [Rhodopirellula sallentina]EMI54139.1 hypothetical protein RSSM_04426 [Rhodopirellula sallentina SM41]
MAVIFGGELVAGVTVATDMTRLGAVPAAFCPFSPRVLILPGGETCYYSDTTIFLEGDAC